MLSLIKLLPVQHFIGLRGESGNKEPVKQGLSEPRTVSENKCSVYPSCVQAVNSPFESFPSIPQGQFAIEI